jgi:hypothetical protein
VEVGAAEEVGAGLPEVDHEEAVEFARKVIQKL